ncbi:hypothetical protein L1049_017269 [Liquidambar formosana]|uniref:Uncharacterized protein n=1 Tax=Liquidambar formosana TaxID=63359 RepID=A0AAP0X159_LIQFO
MDLTRNDSPTFPQNPCLDFFLNVVPNPTPQDLITQLKKAWDHDPLTTLKLICNIRGVEEGSAGKSDMEGFYAAALWLHKNHPKTLALNVRVLANFGYFKDLLEILSRLLEGLKVRSTAEEERIRKKKEKKSARKRQCRCHFRSRERKLMRIKRIGASREERVLANKAKGAIERQNASELRKKKRIEKAKKASEKHVHDTDYRFLHDRISDVFAERLKSDMPSLNSGKVEKVSMASKWCPMIDSSYDKLTLICESIAKKVFPRELYPEYEGVEEAHYVYRVRDRLRKQVLVPLHKALESPMPEDYVSSNQRDLIPYNQGLGNAGIATAALFPHEILASLVKDRDGGKVAELQWRRMVEDLSRKGKLQNCIAICDVSGGMKGKPVQVCVALGLLISELSDDPWKGKFITFSEDPQIHKVVGDDLRSKSDFVRRMYHSGITDFQKVYGQILQVAIDSNLSEDKMINRVFMFSDKEFEKVSIHNWRTKYDAIQKNFLTNGFEKVPELVFWNLKDSIAAPVPSTHDGVALIRGFSKNLLISFLEESGVLNPEAMMQSAIAGEEYKNLMVFD